MGTTLLIDGNSVAYTINLNSCHNSKDFRKLFFLRLREYAKQFTSMPKCILFFDDKFGGNWREKLYPDYQKNRREAKYTEIQRKEHETRKIYLDDLEKFIANSKHKYLHYPHTETDDLIALYCNNIQKENETVVILTTDKDLFQLIREKGNKKVQVLFLIKRKLIKNEKEGQEILHNKIWCGDPSDSIPGVCKNVGKLTLPSLETYINVLRDNNISFDDTENIKRVCESKNIKYIKSFDNFSQEQLELNTRLINLSYVVELDEKENNVKTNYIRDNVKSALFSPYAITSLIY